MKPKERRAWWIDHPYFQYFCGEEFFPHELPFGRASPTRRRRPQLPPPPPCRPVRSGQAVMRMRIGLLTAG